MPAASGQTLLDVVRLSTTYLGDHGSEASRLDAELLVAHALGLRRIDLYLQFDRPLDGAALGPIRDLLRRRARGEPVAYIVGVREFFSRSFEVTPDVLVPRPETETLIEVVTGHLRSRDRCTIADLGTGSGCIAVTLAAELGAANVIAVDVSEAALEVARRNALRHGAASRVELRRGSWLDPLSAPVDAVVSNPPYVTSAELAEVPRDVREFEPRLALDGGPDGLDAYRAMLAGLPRRLNPGGLVAFEVDPRRAGAVAELLGAALPAASPHVVDDLAGSARVVVAET